jgi:hypothetical protein
MNLRHMSPCLSGANLSDSGVASIVHCRNAPLSISVTQQLANVQNVLLRESCNSRSLSILRNFQSILVRMFQVVRRGTPLKVVRGVIQFFPIKMVYLWKFAFVLHESRSDQTMDQGNFSRPLITKNDAEVTGIVNDWLKKPARYIRPIPVEAFIASLAEAFSINGSHAPEIRHLVNSFVPSDWKPKFLHLKLSIKELSLLICARKAGNESAFQPLSLSAQLDYTS